MNQRTLDLQIEQKISEIRGFKMPLVGSALDVVPNEWRAIPSTAVQVRACSLNLVDPDLNVANVVFKPGGYTAPHTHESEETIFCVAGTYVDELNNRTLQAGDVQIVPPGQPHSGRSDYALLVMSWRPAFKNTLTEG